MSTPYKTDVTADARLGYQRKLLDYMRGESVPVLASEQFETLQMQELDDHADAMAEQALSGEIATEMFDRIRLILALAAQRDARYVTAGRRFLFAHGVNNSLRSDFEAYVGTVRTTGDVT